jgi:transposase, IS30 family
VVGVRERQRAVRVMRGQMWSPGRPSTARRDDRVRFWQAIGRGVSSEDAAVATGVSQAVGSRWFRQAGGMPPITLAPLSGRYLSFAEREEIAILHAQRVGVRAIARRVGRAPSTISRELRRNASTRTYRLEYRATTAQWHAERRASRPKVAKLARQDALREYVQDRLAGAIARPGGGPGAGP